MVAKCRMTFTRRGGQAEGEFDQGFRERPQAPSAGVGDHLGYGVGPERGGPRAIRLL